MSAVGVRSDYGFRPEEPVRRKDKGAHRQGTLITRHALFQQALTAADIVTLIVAFAASYYLAATLLIKIIMPLTTYIWLLWVIIPVWILTLRWFGLYETLTYSSLSRSLGHLVRAHFVAALLLLSTMYVTKAVIVSRVLMQTFLTVSFVALAGQKSALQALLKRRRWRVAFNHPRVLLVGNPEKTSRCLSVLERHTWMSAEVVGLLAPCAAEASRSSNAAAPILGEPVDLPEVLNRHVVDEVVALPSVEKGELERLASSCAARGLVMRMLVEVPHPAAGSWHVDDCGEGSFFLSLAAVPQDALQLVAKRIVDIVGALAGLTLFASAAAVYSRRLRRETGATALFRQQRVGCNGRRFTLYKFRTMHHDAERRLEELAAFNEMKGPMFKVKHDPRVTPTGVKLRRRHLDELPQFWNVLKGEMSLVGTRPPTEDEVAHYHELHRRRLSVKPGLTGLWQLNGNHGVSDFEDVVKLDCEYIDNWSLRLDFQIILHTIRKVLRADAW
jgi:exopolysaccharide biosynthesis polyprenyl glycosylphosphotransferase